MFVCVSVCVFIYSSQVFGPISIKLGGWIQVHLEIVLEGFIFGKVKVKVTGLAVCLFLYSSQVFGPISMKLGGWMQVDQEIVLEGFIFGKVKVKVTGSKV